MKSAFITGGSGGIGRTVYDLLNRKGWEVTAPSRKDLDFSSSDSLIGYLMSFKLDFPIFDAIIFCHGKWHSDKFEDTLVDSWRYQMELRVIVPAEFLTFLLLRGIRRDKYRPECIIMTSSTRGLIGGLNTAPYAAACAAQIALMQGYAREYPGTRFNVVCPGLTDTSMGLEVRATGGAKPDAIAQPPEVVADEIVRLIESEDNGRVMRVVDSDVSEAKWTW